MSSEVSFAVDCPYCGAKNEGHVRHGGHDASVFHADAIFVCMYCVAPAFMQEDRTLRLLTREEMEKVSRDGDTVRAMLALTFATRCADAPKTLRWVPMEER